MRRITKRLIIVVNGKLQAESQKLIQQYTEEIIVRPNIGYDAGAYKHVMAILGNEEIRKYDELILCNDTFYGPFDSFENIFAEMEKRKCDFWGLNGFFDVIFAHIQSFFLVFRKEILREGLVFEYFRDFVDEYTMALNDVYCQFETGLFDYLARTHQKKYDKYAKTCNYDVYRYSYEYIKNYSLPVVKKKTFSKYNEDMENIWCTLSYIKYRTSYDIKLVLESIRHDYGLNISENEIQSEDVYKTPEAVHVPRPFSSEKEIERFIGEDEFYIFGAGMYACKTYWRFAKGNKKCKGFVVSDEKNEENAKMLYNLPVYRFSEIKDISEKKVLLGVGSEYSEEAYFMFKKKENVLRIFA